MIVELGLIFLAVACLPLAVIFFSRVPDRRRKLLTVTVALTFELIMFGAFTRLTDSGLGCPDWPGCYGESNPFMAHEEIRDAEALAPHGPVTVSKAWIEMIHRYLAGSLGVLVIAQLWLAWNEYRRRGTSYAWNLAMLALILVQGAFGAWTVTLKLQPVIVTTHLLLGMLLLAGLTISWMLYDSRQYWRPWQLPVSGLRWLAPLAMIILFCQIALGGWTSSNYAALACPDFPSCQGSLIPAMDWQHGFSLWRPLGKTVHGEYLTFQALVAIHWAHRSFAWVAAAVLLGTALLLRRISGAERLATGLIVAVILQIAIGISTVLLSWPLLLAVLHNGMAAVLVILLSMVNYRIWHASRAAAH